MRTIKCCLRHNVEASCRKQDSLMSIAAAFVDRRRRMMHQRYNLYSTVKMLITHDGPAVIDAKAKYWPKMALFAGIRGPRQNIAITFGMEN